MGILLGIIVGLFVLVLLVVLHELGHAIVARRNGVVVEEFGIGFPPRAWKKKLKSGVLFSLNWLPIGGFVKLKGEHDAASGPGTYGGASFWVKTKILLAGVLINWITAAVLFTILALVGLPKIIPQQFSVASDTTIVRSPVAVARVVADSPADKAGLKVKDEIQRVGSTDIKTYIDLSEATSSQAGKTVELTYRRDNAQKTTEVTLLDDKKAKGGGHLGVASSQSEAIRSTWSAPIVGIATTGQLTYETIKGVGTIVVKGLGGLFGQVFGSTESRQAAKADLAYVGESVAGPVGILGVLFPAVLENGLTQIVLLAALISLTLAVMNVLPIPALDGGRWFTMAGFRLFGKKLTKEREETIQATGFLLLMALTVLVTWSDIGKLF